MTDVLNALAAAAPAVVAGLARASAIGALFILAVWAVCRLLPRLSSPTRAALWWLAAAKLLVGLVYIEPFVLPVLPWPQATWRVEHVPSGQGRVGATGLSRPAADASAPPALAQADVSDILNHAVASGAAREVK